jgi:hypothetical protein
MDYNFKFANDITTQTCVASLKKVEDEASKYYRVRKRRRERECLNSLYYYLSMLKINNNHQMIIKFKLIFLFLLFPHSSINTCFVILD